MHFTDNAAKHFVKHKLGKDKVILLAYRGSIAHNMYIPPEDPNSIDDIDLMAVYLKNPRYYLSIANKFEKGKDIKEGQMDLVAYEFKKFVYLLSKSNPNVLTMLWLNYNHYIFADDIGLELVKIRDAFMSKQLFKTFGGYAAGQFKRMTHFKFNGYMGQKRKELVEKFGFDTKNAAHLIRLLRMGVEALETGKLEVFRMDSDELLQIKRGEWTLERVKEEASRLDARLKEAYETSILPDKPDYAVINDFVFNTLKNYINSN